MAVHQDLDNDTGGTFVLPPYTNGNGTNWYRGTADAIYQNLNFVDMIGDDYVLILSGDHILFHGLFQMLDFHKKHQAKVTIGTIRVPRDEATALASWSPMTTCALQNSGKNQKQPEKQSGFPWASIF